MDHPAKFTTYTKKVIENGLLQAEIDHLIGQILPKSGYVKSHFLFKSGYQIKITTRKAQPGTSFSIENRNLIRLTLAQRLNVPLESISIVVNQLAENSLSAAVMADFVKDMLEQGTMARRAANIALRNIMNSMTKPLGAEIIVSGKLRGQRAKPVKFSSGIILHTGDFVNQVVDSAVRHVCLHVGVIGVKVKICMAPTKDMKIPDFIEISKGKENLDDEMDINPSFVIDNTHFPKQLKKYLEEAVKAEEHGASTGEMQEVQ